MLSSVCFLKCAVFLGWLACFGRLSVLVGGARSVLAVWFIEVVGGTRRTKSAGFTTIGGDTTLIGSNEVNVVVLGRRADSLAGLPWHASSPT